MPKRPESFRAKGELCNGTRADIVLGRKENLGQEWDGQSIGL